jgi:hypothetical protein
VVAAPGVGLSALRRSGRVRVAPVAYVLEGSAVRPETGSRRLLAVASVPLAADVRRRRELLLVLLPLCGLTGLVLRGRRGLSLDVRPGPYEVVPIGLDLPSGEETLAIPPVVGVLPQKKVTKLHQCSGGIRAGSFPRPRN